MNLLFEDMIRVETESHVIRVWRQQADGDPRVPNTELDRIVREMVRGNYLMRTIAFTLCSFERVNSVEIVDRATGCGVCAHKDWP